MISINSRVIHNWTKATVRDIPVRGIAWIHYDNDPNDEEHGININELEEIVEEKKLTYNNLTPCVDILKEIDEEAIARSKGSIKKDDNKYDPTMLTQEMIELVSKVRMFGAKKYARNNFKITGFKYTRSLAAALRHIFAYLNGEDNDPESGLSHLGHAICSLEHCIFDSRHHPENDDRKS